MRNETRLAFNSFIGRLAALNSVDRDAVISKFSAAPSVQQTLETRVQESSDFLKKINFYGVSEQEGERIGLGVSGPVASSTDTTSKERQTSDLATVDNHQYRCEQTNFDTHIRYALLDMWAKFPDFQLRLANAVIQRIALDRIMIGWNGTSRAKNSDKAKNPLLQDVNIGWLQKMRTKAPQRHIFETEENSGILSVGAGSDYKNIDALVFDMVNNFIDPWHQEDTQLVAVMGRSLLSDKYFPLVNNNDKPTEQLAADMIISQKRVGNLPAVRVPYFPANGVLVTRLDNLSIYYQEGTLRRSVIDNPKRDCVENFQSVNEAYELEDYGCAAFAENITLVP